MTSDLIPPDRSLAGWEIGFLAECLRTATPDLVDFYTAAPFPRDTAVGPALSAEDSLDTTSHALTVLETWSTSTTALVDRKIPGALGEPGESGNPHTIQSVAAKMGDALRELITWEEQVAATRFHPEWRHVKHLLSGFTIPIYHSFENWRTELASVPERHAAGENNFSLIFEIPPFDGNELSNAIQRAHRRSTPFWKRHSLLSGLFAGAALSLFFDRD